MADVGRELAEQGPSQQLAFEFFSEAGRDPADIAKVGTFGTEDADEL